MTPYWLMFLVPAIAALSVGPRRQVLSDLTLPLKLGFLWSFVGSVLALLIGFRYQVGGDWYNYFRYLVAAKNMPFANLFMVQDPGYWAFNIISEKLGLGITGVNTFSSIFFSAGLIIFCRSLPRPWLALACAIPYLVIVVGMGYTRQSVAIGLAMIGFVMLSRERYLFAASCVLIGALFHRSAVLLIPLAGMTVSKNRLFTLLLVIVTTGLGYFLLLADSANELLQTYVDAEMQSRGALIRLVMNALPAVLMLITQKKFLISASERKIWILFSWGAVGMVFLFLLTHLGTALDRMALYVIPLQLFVFSHIPDVVGRRGGRNLAIVLAILVYYAVAMFIWLNLGDNAHWWIPYQIGVA